MTQLVLLADILYIAAQAGFWAAIGFPAVTALFWPWWQSAWGWTIVLLDLCVALVLLGTVMEHEWGVVPVGAGAYALLWCETVPVCLIPLIIIWRGILVFVTQRRTRP